MLHECLLPQKRSSTGLQKKVFLKFPKFHRKAPVLYSLVNNVAGLKAKETPTEMFSCEICELFKNTCIEEHLRTTASTDTADS